MENIEKRIDELLSRMTVREKIGQLNQVETVREDKKEELKEKIRKGEVGSILMSVGATAGNTPQGNINTEFYDEIQRVAVEESLCGIPMIFGRDVIHGHTTVSPIPLAMAAAFNEKLVERVYRDIAREAANDGVHWTFAPMLDVSKDPRWGRCVEGPGEDPYVGAQLARAVVKGFQSDDLTSPDSIAACAKHYIGYGAGEGGRDYHHTEITDHSIRNYYLEAFRAAVDAGVQTVMNSFNEIGGQPTVSSRYLMTDVLRGELGFDGFVVADYNAVLQQIAEGAAEDEKSAAAQAINAGTDMDMVDDFYINYLEECLANGTVDMATLDEAVRRVLRVKLRMGIFEHPYTPKLQIDREKHIADARNLAGESIVLLKNKDNILPLKKNARVAMVGPFVHERASMLGSWALDGKPSDVVTLNQGMNKKNEGGKVFCYDGALSDEQLMNGRYCDVTLLAIGESRRVTGENNCVGCIEVNAEYVDMAKRAKAFGKPVVAVLCYGRPTALEEIEPYCDAIVWCWHLGTEAGNAIADVLYGDVNPSGKLPMTLPRFTGQIPIYYNVLPSTHDVNGYYEEAGCYRDRRCMPMYPFGYGLSYTDFAVSDIILDRSEISMTELSAGGRIKASVNVTNTGSRKGKTVLQLYIHDIAAKMARPMRELKGYRKTELAEGETETVSFDIGFSELAYYMGGEHLVEKGGFEIFIGDSSMTKNRAFIKVI